MGHPTLENETPFVFEFMGLTDEQGQPLLLLLVKATYAMGAAKLKLAEQQVPVCWGGVPWGEPGESSYKYEPECAFIKPATDVVLIGHAYPPKGATEVLVALQVGPLRKAVQVMGERTWFRSMGRVAMTKPLPFERMPLTWERAFGGWDKSDPDPKMHSFESRNPVGTGFRASSRLFEEGLRLPNLEAPEHPLREFGQKVPPTGFGFTSPHWHPRAAYAGTYDETWDKTRKPLLPKDFGLFCTMSGLEDSPTEQRSVKRSRREVGGEGFRDRGGHRRHEVQDMGSGGPRPGGSAMDRISGSPSGSGSSASGCPVQPATRCPAAAGGAPAPRSTGTPSP